jgi:hypothetical protein
MRFLANTIGLSLLMAGMLARAATVSGTVTDKTTNKPAAGDQVTLVEPMAGMSEVGHATTNAQGRYSLNLPGAVPYLIRVTHQGGEYFIPAPQGGGTGDISVYDVAAKVEGVTIEADVIQAEAENGQLSVDERYFVHNTSSPPTTQWSQKSFSIVLPVDAQISGVNAQRPNGLPTSIKLDPDGPKGHYSFNFPIQPDDGDKDTMFQIVYTLPYSGGKFRFQCVESLPADSLAVLLPKSMSFAAGSGAAFSPVNPPQSEPGVSTYLAKNVAANKAIEFTISGTGALPREDQGGDQGAGAQASGPGGGIGEPINTPDPLSKYKWWILAGLALLLAAAAAFLLRRPAMAGAAAPEGMVPPSATAGSGLPQVHSAPVAPATGKTALLNALKEELFALESEKIGGTLAPKEYAEQKAALETVLKRALKKS